MALAGPGGCDTGSMVDPVAAPGDLTGGWRFHRRLRDTRTGEFGRARGWLTVDDVHCSWIEVGELEWGGRSVPITRTMGFTRMDGEWWMTFADGRAFHPWRPGVSVEHPCGGDVYRGLLAVSADGCAVRIGWDVRGPDKDQRILTTYRRLTS